MTPHVYYMTPDFKDNRPDLRKFLYTDKYHYIYDHANEVFKNKATDKDSARPRVVVANKSTKYDFYSMTDFHGLCSSEMTNVLDKHIKGRYKRSGIYLNDRLYYLILLPKKKFLDLNRSSIEFDEDSPDEIVDIKKYVLTKSKIPKYCLFILTQGGSFPMCSQALKDCLVDVALKGLAFRDVELHGVKPWFMKGSQDA
jgi:hypothetical protein